MINKFNKKKALIYGIVMLMVTVTVFISCTTQSIAKEDENIVPIDWGAEPKTVDVVFPGYSTHIESASPMNVTNINQMVAAVNDRLLEELNCKINFKWIYYQSYTEDLAVMLSSDDCPDMIAQYSIPDYYQPLAEKNLLVDITDMKYQYMPKLTKRLEKLTPNYFDNQNLQGDLYTMPSVGYYPQRNIVAVLKTIQDEYGKEINTLEDYEEFMIWCQTAYPDMTAGYYYDQLLFIETYMQSKGYTQVSSSIYIHTASNQTTHYPMEMMDEFCDAYSTMKRWHSSGYLGNLTVKTFPNALKNNKLASILINYMNLSDIPLSLSEGNELFYHVLNEDQKIPSSPNGHGFVFCKNGDAVEDSMRFLEWVHEKQDNFDLIKYGIEDAHYTLEDNKISFPNYYMSDIYQWFGSAYFDDYTYDRALVNEPDNYKDIISRTTITNSFSEYKYFNERKKAILTFTQGEKDSIKVFEGKISNTLNKRVEVLYYLFDLWEKGDFSMSSDEVIELLLAEGQGNELYNLYKEIDEFIQEK